MLQKPSSSLVPLVVSQQSAPLESTHLQQSLTSARLVLVCGLPGSGKTTYARKLERALGAVRLCPDEELIRRNIDLYDAPARDLLEIEQWVSGQHLLREGRVVILESGFWTRSERDDKRQTAGSLGVPVELHYLHAPIDELWQRTEKRIVHDPSSVPISREDLVSWSALFEAPTEDELALFDKPIIANVNDIGLS